MTTVMKKRKDEQQAEDQSAYQGCIGTAEFDNAMMRVGERPYYQTAEALGSMTQDTIEYLISKGFLNPEDLVRRKSDNKQR